MIADKFFNQYGGYTREEMLREAVKFAKACVQEALIIAADNAVAKENPSDYGTGEIWVDKKSILEAYSLNKIKAYEI
jgi:hypothetical protein